MKSFDDKLTDTVYLTESLAFRYPGVYWPMRINLEANGITVKTVSRTRNIWIRDYFPVQVNGEFIRFQYGKENEKWPQLDISNEPWTGLFEKPIKESKLKIDGGNIVQGCGKVILTDRVIKDNGKGVIGKLENLFQAKIIIIPMEPGDSLGHSDGICKIIDEKTVLINDYSSIFDKDKRFIKYSKALIQLFKSEGFNVELMPYGHGDWDWEMTEAQFRQICPEGDDFNPGFGYFLNFLMVKGLILMPAMKLRKDTEGMATLRRLFPGFNVVAIDCAKLSLEGGLLHCVSANYAR